jgi:uncharacterized protein with HEPN domain
MKDNIYLERIIKYTKKINRCMEPIDSFEMFLLNEEKIDAVTLNLEQIGETVKKLSKEFTNNFTEIDWKNIKGLRNMISHEYEGIKVEIIYYAATTLINDVLTILIN